LRRRSLLALLALALAGASLFAAVGYWNATAAPIVRRLNLRIAGYPADSAPVRILLFSDLHVHGPDMPPRRVSRIVDQINALHPDIVVAAGDFIGHNWLGANYPIDDAIAPLARLKPRLGVFAVLGNADYDAARRLDDRLCTIERIMTAENPDWRQQCLPGREREDSRRLLADGE
jgi:hypothetical protein